MAMSNDNNAQAERFIKFRILAATLIAFGLLAAFANTYWLNPITLPDYIDLLTWPTLAATLLMILANGQERLWSNVEGVRRLLGDESTVDNRRRAQAFGFWAMIVCGIGVYAAAIWFEMPAPKAVQLVVTLALGAAALRFAVLEQHALNP
jgi:O-antigen/teichoic acid export membrane protein